MHDQVAGERVDVLEAYGGVVGDQRRPVLGRGRRDRRGGQLEVGAGVVVQDQEAVLAADHGVVEGVLQRPRGARRRPGSPRSGASASRKRYSEVVLEPPATTMNRSLRVRPDADPEPAVGLVVDQLVVGLGGAEPVPPDLVGAPGLVDGRVVEVLAVAVPGGAAEDAGDLVVEQLAGARGP